MLAPDGCGGLRSLPLCRSMRLARSLELDECSRRRSLGDSDPALLFAVVATAPLAAARLPPAPSPAPA